MNGIFAHKPIGSLNTQTVINLYTYVTSIEAMKIISSESPFYLSNNFQVKRIWNAYNS